MSLLRAEGIATHFGGVRAVDGVSLAVDAGGFAALIGPNGSGKSTLFSVIAGQLRADAGRIEFDGEDISRSEPVRHARRGIGRTFQTAAAFASMTVLQNAQLALAAHAGGHLDPCRPLQGMHVEAGDALLARVGLEAQGSRPVADLAYAVVKRLELAIALGGQPRLLLMDEPTAGMAAGERSALMDHGHCDRRRQRADGAFHRAQHGQALTMANDSVYGLQAGVFTRNLAHAWQAFETLEVRGVIINDVPAFRVDNMPYGGVKASGLGREGVRYAMEELTDIRLMALRI